MTRRSLYAGVAIGLLQIIDVATTQSALAHGAVEANPLMAAMMGVLGSGWIVAKMAFGLGVGAYFATRPRLSWLGYAALGLSVLVVAQNLFHFV